jgi:hypothetical protein
VLRAVVRRFPLLVRRDAAAALSSEGDRVAGRLDGCACVRRFAAAAAGSRRCRKTETVATWSDGAKDGVDVVSVSRCLCR